MPGAVLAVATIIGAAACSAPQVTDPGDAVPEGPEIVVGASLELSGPGASIGLVEQRALLVAVEKINEHGVRVGGERRRLRLVIRDNLGRPPVARDAARDLVRTDKAVAIIGGITEDTAMALAAVAEEEQVPLFAFASSDRVTQPIAQRRFVFTVAPKSADVAAHIIGHLESMDRGSPISLFAASDPHGDAGVPAIVKAAGRSDLSIEEPVRFSVSGSDLTERAAEVAAQEPKVIIVWATLPGPGPIATALRGAGYRGDIIFDSGAGGEATLPQHYLDAVAGTYMIHPESLSLGSLAASSPDDLDRKDFYARYTRSYGTFSGYAPYGADAIGMLAEALRRSDTASGPSLRDALEADPISGVAAIYDYSPTSHNGFDGRALAVYEARRGEWVRTS